MPVEVILPKVDMDMASGRITRWYVAEGAPVTKGEPLFEIETDKAAMEIEAPASGTLAHVTGKIDVDIDVGAPVAWIYADGEAMGDPPPVMQALNKTADGTVPPPSPLPDRPPVPAPAAEIRAGEKPRATPLARRLARTAGIVLGDIPGSGPRGRITRSDVVLWTETAQAETEAPHRLPQDEGIELIPHSAMRRTIARRMVASVRTVPHFYLTTDCAIDALQRLRAELNASATRAVQNDPVRADWKISVTDMVVKALAAALHAVPEANVTWTDEAMARHAHVDVAVATDIPGGLVTPVLRRVETRSLSAISNELADLVARARAGDANSKNAPDDYRGGTTNVSNLGMYGVSQFGAIINPPHSTALAIGRGERQPVFADDGVSVIGKTLMTVTLSADHRAIDGALAARLLSTFKSIIEDPLRLIL